MTARVATFGNNRSWAVNRLYKRYRATAQHQYRSSRPRDEVTEGNGALHVKSRAVLNEARRRGFRHRSDDDRARATCDDDAHRRCFAAIRERPYSSVPAASLTRRRRRDWAIATW